MKKESLRAVGKALAAIVALGVLSGCAEIMPIHSIPSGAKVILDGTNTGQSTPANLQVRDVDVGKHTVTVAMDGYTTVTPQKDFGIHRVVGRAIAFSLVLTPVFGILDCVGTHCKDFGPDKPEYKETWKELAEKHCLTFELKKNE